MRENGFLLRGVPHEIGGPLASSSTVMKLTGEALEDRLISFGADVCRSMRRLPNDLAGAHLGRQLIRSATSPAANYAEARGAESRRDFAHKLQICLKELRETYVWLRLVHRIHGSKIVTRELRQECNELIAIFVKSILTAKTPKTLNKNNKSRI